jgi:hypothetical protein
MGKRLKLVGIWLAFSGAGPLYADFALDPGFMAVQPSSSDRLPGWDWAQLSKLPPQTLAELMATMDDPKLPRPKPTPLRKKPVGDAPRIVVQSPKTGDKPITVPLTSPVDHDENEILAEAARLLEMELPPLRELPRMAPSRPASPLEPSELPRHALDTASAETGGELQIREQDGRLKIIPETLTLRLDGPAIRVVFAGTKQKPQIFIRDRKTLRWNSEVQQLQGIARGRSELYITQGERLYILPVEVQGAGQRQPLAVSQQQSLEQLTSIMPAAESFASLGVGADSPTGAKESSEALTLAQAAAAVDLTQARTLEEQSRFVYPDPSPDYRTFAVQVLDERSAPEANLVYPVSGVKVKLIGSQVQAETDAKGQALFGEMPDGARFWVLIEDDKGRTVPTVSELSLQRGSKNQVLRARTLSYRTYFAYQSVLDLAQDTNLGSLCGRAMQDDGKKALAGMRVGINVEADGPIYIGAYGPQRDLQATDASGRFCFFNVKPGLVELSFHAGNEYRTAVALPVFPGAHSEEELLLENTRGRRLFLASVPSAMEQIYADDISSQPYQAVDGIELLSIGENQALDRLSPGVLAQEAGATSFKGRVYALAQAPEFENVLYSLDKDKEWRQHMPVVPLVQRGFIEDLYHELNLQDGQESVPFDPAMGQALVFHRLEAGQSQVKISLIDTAGRVLDQAWYFGNPTHGATKAVFFNLQPGLYQVRVESLQGALLAMDTFAVDYWTTALIQSGSSLQYSTNTSRISTD